MAPIFNYESLSETDAPFSHIWQRRSALKLRAIVMESGSRQYIRILLPNIVIFCVYIGSMSLLFVRKGLHVKVKGTLCKYGQRSLQILSL